MEKPGNHDQFFKEIFSQKAHIADLLQYMLPPDLRDNLDLQSLRLENTSYTDNDLRYHFSDLVYSCQYMGHRVKVSLLFEHKSIPDANLPIQLLRYLACIWNEQIKQRKKPAPIIPIVLYHGRQQWAPGGIADCFKWSDAEILSYTPAFKYQFIDLSKYSIEVIKDRLFDLASVKMALLVLKYISNPEALEKSLKEFFEVGRIYFEDDRGLIFLETVIKYIYRSTEIDKNKMAAALNQISPKGGELAMTTAEKLREEGLQQGLQQGKQQGMQQGMQQGKQELMSRLKSNGMPIEEIARLTDMNVEEIKKMLANRIDTDKE